MLQDCQIWGWVFSKHDYDLLQLVSKNDHSWISLMIKSYSYLKSVNGENELWQKLRAVGDSEGLTSGGLGVPAAELMTDSEEGLLWWCGVGLLSGTLLGYQDIEVRCSLGTRLVVQNRGRPVIKAGVSRVLGLPLELQWRAARGGGETSICGIWICDFCLCSTLKDGPDWTSLNLEFSLCYNPSYLASHGGLLRGSAVQRTRGPPKKSTNICYSCFLLFAGN